MFWLKKNSKDSIIAVECDWNSKTSQNVQNLGFLMENYGGFFEKKNWFFPKKIAERSKLAVTQDVQNLVIINKIYGFFEKKLTLKKSPKLKLLL